jgi:hypothetical protein
MRRKIVWGAMAAALIVLAAPLVALAHEKVTVGPYTVEVGWVDEPPLVGVKNAVAINITNTDSSEPIEGVNTLEVSVSTGGKTLKLDLLPLSEDLPGQYAATFIPTRRGVYTVKLSGKIEDTAVDVSQDIEEVAEAAALQFPEPLVDTQALTQTASRAEAAANSANTTALIGVGVGALGLLVGLFSLIRSRRS